MINIYEGTGINDIYVDMVDDVMKSGAKVLQRGLTTRELTPVIFQLEEPRRRLVTSYGRPVNVAFAAAEVLWILAGRKDVAMLEAYNSRIGPLASDDGETFNAAYGHRLRYAHGFDQLEDCILTLQSDSGSRQAILNIWLPGADRGWRWGRDDVEPNVTKDRACNVVSHLLVRDGALHWTQFMRSNDALWGLPYNVMQWTHIQEYVATRLGVEMGCYTHLSDSFHVYDPPLDGSGLPSLAPFDLYDAMGWAHEPMTAVSQNEILAACDGEEMLRTGAARYVGADAVPTFWANFFQLFAAHRAYVDGEDENAYAILRESGDPVYATAQIRFYVHQRWQKDADSPIHNLITRDFRPDIRDWLYGAS